LDPSQLGYRMSGVSNCIGTLFRRGLCWQQYLTFQLVGRWPHGLFVLLEGEGSSFH